MLLAPQRGHRGGDRGLTPRRAGVRACVSLLHQAQEGGVEFLLAGPGSQLGGRLRRDLWRLFHSLAEGGSTLLVSSNVMDEAERCDSLLLLRDGGLLGALTPDELRDRTGERDLEAAFLQLAEAE